MAPPTSRAVSSIPPASPLTAGSTPVKAATCTATADEPDADADGEEAGEQVGPVRRVGRGAGQQQQAGRHRPAGRRRARARRRSARPAAAARPPATTSELSVAASQATPVAIAE